MLDEFRSTNITWDKATSRIYSPVTANESDENGRKLVVQIVNSGQVEDLTGSALHLYWITRDKLHDGLDVFKAVDLKKGEFELSYTTGMLSNKGVLNANLVFVDAVGRVVSERFKISVTEGINNDAIQSENSFTTLTQALIDISNLEQNYAPRLNDLTAQLQPLEHFPDLQKRLAIMGGELNLDYKTVSSTVTPYQLENGLSNDTIDHLLFQGADSVLCLMVSIDNDNSFTFSKMSDNIITTQIERAIQKGLKISMLKPHIGINFSDGYYRKNYNPSNMSSCFTNWFDVLEDYANMCVKYNIPILSLGCEQYEMTNNIHFDLWNKHINRLRLKFPTLLFTYAFDSHEWHDDEHTDMMKLLDIIGVNLYPTFTTKMIGEKITVEELKESLSFDLFADEFSNPKVKRRTINRLKELHSLYEKNIFITEFGTMSYRDSLISPVSNLIGVEDNGYYEAQALCFETILTVLPRYSFICGVSVWHTAEPFNYFSSTMITEAERTLKNLFEVIK